MVCYIITSYTSLYLLEAPVAITDIELRRSLTTLTRQGISNGNVNDMQIITVEELQCQQGVGRWSIIAKIWSTYLKNEP